MVDLGVACMPSGHATDRATAPGSNDMALEFDTCVSCCV